MRRTLRSVAAFFLKGAGAACALGWNVLLAREAPPSVYAATAVSFGLTLLLSTLVRSGNDLLVLRAAARLETLSGAFRTTAYASVACGVGLIVLAGPLARVLDLGEWRVAAAVVAVSVPLHATGWLLGEALKGRGAPLRAVMVQQVVVQAVPLVGFTATSVTSTPEALLWLLLGYMGAVLLGLPGRGRDRKDSPETPGNARTEPTTRSRWSASVPLLVLALANSVIMWADVLMLSALRGAGTAATYNISLRLAAVVGFALLATSAVFTPDFAKSETGRRRPSIRTPVFLGAAFGAVTATGIWVLRTDLVGLFGIEYRAATEPLSILLLGYIVHAALGIGGYRLVMMGGDWYLGRASLIAAGGNVLLNLILIPRFGMIGAAVSSALAIVTMDILVLRWTPRSPGRLTAPAGRSHP